MSKRKKSEDKKKSTAFTRLLREERSGRKPKKRRNHSKYCKMPIGKFKGRPVDQIPHWYLRWFLEEVDDYTAVKQDISAVLSGTTPATRAKRAEVAQKDDAARNEAKQMDDEFKAIVGGPSWNDRQWKRHKD